MMLVVAEKNPIENALYIKENTNKNFLFKSLLELGQLICSCGISNVFKRVHRAKEIQKWILNNKLWVYRYYTALYFICSTTDVGNAVCFVVYTEI